MAAATTKNGASNAPFFVRTDVSPCTLIQGRILADTQPSRSQAKRYAKLNDELSASEILPQQQGDHFAGRFF